MSSNTTAHLLCHQLCEDFKPRKYPKHKKDTYIAYSTGVLPIRTHIVQIDLPSSFSSVIHPIESRVYRGPMLSSYLHQPHVHLDSREGPRRNEGRIKERREAGWKERGRAHVLQVLR